MCKHIYLLAIATTILLNGVSSRHVSAELPQIAAKQVAINNDEREDGDDYTADLEMILINKQGKRRVRKIRSFRKDYGRDDKSVMFFLEPADVKNTGFLTWNYADSEKDDEQWLYLPALKKVRRISSSGQDDYFMGSDFTYSDLGDNDVDDYTYTHLEPEAIDGVECYHLERLPKDDEVLDETGYGRAELWIHPKNWLVVKGVYFDSKLKLLKEFSADEIEEIDGIPTVTTTIMNHKQNEHQTVLKFSNITYNTGVEDGVFSERRLKKGTRER